MNLRKNIKAKTVVTMWKISDLFKLAVSIIKYVTVYGIEQVSISLILSVFFKLGWQTTFSIFFYIKNAIILRHSFDKSIR